MVAAGRRGPHETLGGADMDYEQWLAHGQNNRWIDGFCLMHDFDEYLTQEELHSYHEDGEDPCVPRWVVKPQ